MFLLNLAFICFIRTTNTKLSGIVELQACCLCDALKEDYLVISILNTEGVYKVMFMKSILFIKMKWIFFFKLPFCLSVGGQAECSDQGCWSHRGALLAKSLCQGER